jgi:hypothetical protein
MDDVAPRVADAKVASGGVHRPDDSERISRRVSGVSNPLAYIVPEVT